MLRLAVLTLAFFGLMLLSGCGTTQRATAKKAYEHYVQQQQARTSGSIAAKKPGGAQSGSKDKKGASATGKGGSAKGSTANGKTGKATKVSADVRAACEKLGVGPLGVVDGRLYLEAASWLGVGYKYGGNKRSTGVDCSGLTGLIYQAVYGKTLQRSSADVLSVDCRRIGKGELREGDLVFFRTDGKKTSTPNHVGIYLKDNKFIHSSTSRGVIVSSLEQDYYVRNWIAGGRVKR